MFHQRTSPQVAVADLGEPVMHQIMKRVCIFDVIIFRKKEIKGSGYNKWRKQRKEWDYLKIFAVNPTFVIIIGAERGGARGKGREGTGERERWQLFASAKLETGVRSASPFSFHAGILRLLIPHSLTFSTCHAGCKSQCSQGHWNIKTLLHVCRFLGAT